jgi:hypothetical protein
MDTEAFYNQVELLQMLNQKAINHSQNLNKPRQVIPIPFKRRSGKHSGNGRSVHNRSSNLTRAGLSGQEEFTVSIKDYGFNEAWFDELWERGLFYFRNRK